MAKVRNNASTVKFPQETALPPIRRKEEGTEKVETPYGPDEVSYSSKLTNVEAQRIMSVIQDIQRKIQIINLLPEATDRRPATVFNMDTLSALKNYWDAEVKYKTCLENTDPGKAYQTEMKEYTKQLKLTTREITRLLSLSSSELTKLKYLKVSKGAMILQFEGLIQEVKTLVYERLKTTVEEERARQDQLSLLIARERKTSNEVRTLKEELDKAKKERSNAIHKKNEVIWKLKEELKEIKQQAEEATKKLEFKSKQNEDQDMQQFKDKENTLKREILALTEQLHDLIQRNRDEEALLRKKKYKIESEVENWIAKYDQDMEEKQTEIEDISAIFVEERAQLTELQNRYAELQKENDKINEEKNKREQLKQEEALLKLRKIKAAILIQARIRGFLARKQYKKLQSKNKKGKKK